MIKYIISEKGKYRDCYFLEIESPEIIESCKPIEISPGVYPELIEGIEMKI